ncbi:MAG: cupredoxin family copper-binding protein [Nitrosopumilus sp.]|nr:cupredoxin family copper-binding protein [Nitrosopumilus sp.]
MKSQGISLVIASVLVAIFLISPMMVFTEDFSVIIPQGASNRLCATFHNCYSPEKITVSAGDSITWINKDSDFHSVTSGKPGAVDDKFDSELFPSGESWTFTFTNPEEYDYFCTIHPWMVGKITVLAMPQNEENTENLLKIPEWVKTNAKWWSTSQISDSDFAKGLEHLIRIDVITIPQNTNPEQAESETQIPGWLRNNAGWWSQGLLSDEEFAQSIEYLIVNGMIRL